MRTDVWRSVVVGEVKAFLFGVKSQRYGGQSLSFLLLCKRGSYETQARNKLRGHSSRVAVVHSSRTMPGHILPEQHSSTVNPRYNDSICSQRRCHNNTFAVVENTL